MEAKHIALHFALKGLYQQFKLLMFTLSLVTAIFSTSESARAQNLYVDGQVGIGTTSPAYSLDAKGRLRVFAPGGNPGNWPTSGVGVNILYNDWDSPQRGVILAYDHANQKGMPLTLNEAGGSVGIGTTSPAFALDTRGIVRALAPGGNPHGSNWPRSGIGVEFFYNDWEGNNRDRGVIISFDRANLTGKPLTLNETGGNVGIGTTVPLYALHVNGVAAATSFTNLSSREYKQDVAYLNAAEYRKMLNQVLRMKPARYRYKKAYGGDDRTVHLGFIAEEMPKEVLSPSGNAVDMYQLITYMAGAMKAQQARIDQLEEKLISVTRTSLP